MKPHALLVAAACLGSLASHGLTGASISISDLVADDPDESGESFDESDTLSVHFSEPTSEPLGSGLAKSDIDALLAFSSEVHGDYWAFWNSSSVLVVHFGVVDAATAPAVGSFRVSCRAAAAEVILGNASGGGCVGSSPPLRGAWGYRRPSLVSLASAAAHDPDDGDEEFSAGDVLTLRFSTPTDRAGRDAALGELSMAEISDLLWFHPHPAGSTFAANWSDDSASLTLVVREAGAPPPRAPRASAPYHCPAAFHPPPPTGAQAPRRCRSG